ncbi:MAG: tetratricopeptide repeat protein [Rickettsiales bacterium]|nr:tetratricopeptide repeat protein [Rickettsiales bacterium]
MQRSGLIIVLFSALSFSLVSNGVEIALHDDGNADDKVEDLQSKMRIVNNQNKNLHAKILEIEEKLREITGKMQDLEHLEAKFTNKVQNLAADTNLRFETLEKKIANSKSSNTSSLDKAVSAPMVKYLNMIEQKNYKGAIQGLERYIGVNHSSPTLGEAYYWLGYAYMSSQDYTKAIKMFVNSYNGYPKSSKAEYSLLNMAVSLYRIKEYNKSCVLLKKLISTSQNKQILSLAQYQQKDFKCKSIEDKPTKQNQVPITSKSVKK